MNILPYFSIASGPAAVLGVAGVVSLLGVKTMARVIEILLFLVVIIVAVNWLLRTGWSVAAWSLSLVSAAGLFLASALRGFG